MTSHDSINYILEMKDSTYWMENGDDRQDELFSIEVAERQVEVELKNDKDNSYLQSIRNNV